MSEAYQIFVLGVLLALVQMLLAGILGWLAWELRQLRRDVGHRIHFADCDRRMSEHNRRLELLERKG